MRRQKKSTRGFDINEFEKVLEETGLNKCQLGHRQHDGRQP